MLRKIIQARFTVAIVILLALVMMIFSTFSANIIVVYSQKTLTNTVILPKKATTNTSNSTSSPSPSITSPPKLHAVKIISPAKGQQVPIGKDLTISGTSMDTVNSGCQITVTVNRVKPAQVATAGGPGGPDDYSKWNFIISPSKYTNINQGQNRISAKYACSSVNTGVLSSDSVNVTGVSTLGAAAATTTTAANAISDTTIIKKSIPISSNSTIASHSPSSSSSISKANNNNNAGSHVSSVSSSSYHSPAQLSSSTTSSRGVSKQVKPTLNYENSNNIPNLNSNILHIKITSPVVGQLVPVSSNLLVTGTSSDTASTNCKVYAGLNGYNLYQPAIAAGAGGVTDYSKWYFKYTPTPAAYYAITPGGNTLIAKLTCNGNPSLVKYASTDITGIVAGLPPPPIVIVPSSSASTAYTSYDPVPSTSSYTTHSSAKVHKVHDSSSSSSDGGTKVKVRKVRDSSSSSSSDGGSSSSDTNGLTNDDNSNNEKITHNHITSNIQDSSSDVGTKVKVHDGSSSNSDAGSSKVKVHKVPDIHSSAKVHKVRDSSSDGSDVGTKVKVHDSKDNYNNNDSNGLANNIIKDVKKSLKNGGINVDLG
jgi:hypothetical protein